MIFFQANFAVGCHSRGLVQLVDKPLAHGGCDQAGHDEDPYEGHAEREHHVGKDELGP